MTKRKIIPLIILVIVTAGTLFFLLGRTQEEGLHTSDTEDTTSPFGTSDPRDFDGSSDEEVNDLTAEFASQDLLLQERLRPLVSESIAFEIIDETDPEGDSGYPILSIQPSTGHVYRGYSNSLYTEIYSNTTIPRIQSALFSPNGDHVVLRYVSTNGAQMDTFVAEITRGEQEIELATTTSTSTQSDLERAPYRLEGVFLPAGVITYAFSPDGGELFYLLDRGTISEGIVLTLEGNTEETLFSTPLKELEVMWHENGSMYFQTRPSGSTEGYLFVLQGGQLRKIFEGGRGFTSLLSPSGNRILLSEVTTTGELNLSVWDRGNRSRQSFEIKTLPEKCIWQDETTFFCAVPKELQRSTYPDVWYRGDISFDDALYKVDVASGVASMLVDPEDYGYDSLDMTQLDIDVLGSLLVFIDNLTSSSWIVRLN